jgi:glycosyltransferase involved in cell wall biosynthesis
MRVLQISSAERYGGGEKHFCDLANGLTKEGVAVFAAVRPDCSWRARLEELAADRVVEVSLRGSADIVSAMKLSKLIRANEIDIVHAHMARDYLPASMAVRFAGRAALVLTRHVLFPISGITRSFVQNAARIIAVSSAVESALHGSFRRERLASIPNGIDLARFAESRPEMQSELFRQEYGIPLDSRLIATVGELNGLKGQEEFVLASAEIAKDFPDAYFLSIGKDNSRGATYKRKLRRLVKVLGLEEKFKFLEWVEDTAPLLSALDIFVSASHSESFGLAILEAMASGKPVVATETGGARELIENGRSGILVKVKDPVAIASAVCNVLRDDSLAARLGNEALRRARDGFSIERMVAATAALYSEILDQRSPDDPS